MRSERGLIYYCHYASSANTARIEPSDQKAVTISGSSAPRRDPRYITDEEDKGVDGLTSRPSVPVCDINERKTSDETEGGYVECVCLKPERQSRGRLVRCETERRNQNTVTWTVSCLCVCKGVNTEPTLRYNDSTVSWMRS